MKRMISLLLCLLLMAGMATTAFAATEGKVDLTITGQTGHEYIAFQIFSGDVVLKDGKYILGNVGWGNGVKSGNAVVDKLKASNETITDSTGSGNSTTLGNEFRYVDYEAQSVAKVMAGWGDKLDRIKAFAKFMYENEKDLLYKDQGKTSEVVEDVPVIKDLEPGYYLIMDAAVFNAGVDGTPGALGHDFYTSILMNLTSTTTIAVKGSVPTVDKLVSNYLNVTGTYGKIASNQINLDHFYQLTGTVAADIADYESYYYQFEDHLNDGLQFQRIEEIAIKSNTGETLVYKADSDDEGTDPDTYLLKEVDFSEIAAESNGTLTVTFEDLKTAFTNRTIHKGDEIVVRYSAQLDPNKSLVVVDDGNQNVVKLIYGNNPYGNGTGVTATSEARVYTFPMEVLKVNDSGVPLEGAKFVLYHMHDNVRLYAKIDEKNNIVGWKEIVDGKDDADTSIENELKDAIDAGEVSVMVSAAAKADGTGKGLIYVNGLKAKTDYFLSEIQPPAGGYNKPLSDTEVSIQDFTVGGDNKVKTLTYDVNNEPTTVAEDKPMVVKLSITNKLGTVLPSTGGMGTTVLYIVGGILVLAAVVLLVTKKRMKDAE